MSDDERWMAQALALAARGRGRVEPNPMVGAVVLDAQGQLVGEGWHQKFGEAHAEVHALAAAGERATDGTLYVTLEPCCHHGKTPPCTEAVLRSRVRRVVVATADPFPRVAGGGIAILRAAGILVELGIGEVEARRLNAPYFKLLLHGQPWVHLKWAMTWDGKIATRTGDSRWISCEASRAMVHDLRGRMDAIVVGRGTVQLDDPALTVRPVGPRRPTRIVLCASGELPADCQLVRTAHEVPVLVFTSPGCESKLQRWADAGVEIVGVQTLMEALQELGRRRMTNILVEGGAGVLGSFLDQQAADEVHLFLAPVLVGGDRALSPIGGLGVETIARGVRLLDPVTQVVGVDVYLRGRLHD